MRIDAFKLSAQVPPQDDLLEAIRARFRLFLDRLTSEPGQASLMLELWLLINLIANGLAMGLAGGGDIGAVYRAADGLAFGIAAQGRLSKKKSPVG